MSDTLSWTVEAKEYGCHITGCDAWIGKSTARPESEDLANATLIAAAPDLLAACWMALQYLETRADAESNQLWGEVSAAYRKAIGEDKECQE